MTNISLSLPELIRIFSVQETPRLMLLLGAGASMGAGLPTAIEMTWIYKREIYCSETGASPEAFRDLTSKDLQKHLQNYFDQKKTYPSLGDDAEYSFYFEACYPDSTSRRYFIRQQIQKGVPTIGHECLAVLLAQGKVEWIWTTNFDDLIEKSERSDSLKRIFHVGPDSHYRVLTALSEGFSPILVKLHGDYRYDRLSNTTDELQKLDSELRKALIDQCSQNGLIVVGYSGRDESIMSALEESARTYGFHYGLYWCVKEGTAPNQRVKRLISNVVEISGVGGIVEISSFDDIMYRFYKQCRLFDDRIENKADEFFEKRKPFQVFKGEKLNNPLKTNAIRVLEYPSTPFKAKAKIGDWQELRETIDGFPLIAGLFRGYAIVFGNLDELRDAFRDKITGSIETVEIRTNDLKYDGVMMGLLYDIIGNSLTREYGLCKVNRRLFYMPDPSINGKSRRFSFVHLKKEMGVDVVTLDGNYFINEGFSLQLDFHEDELWFLILPQVVITTDGQSLAPFDVRRKKPNSIIASRYNKKAHEILIFWLYYLKSISDPITFAFPSRTETLYKLVLDEHFAFSSLVE